MFTNVLQSESFASAGYRRATVVRLKCDALIDQNRYCGNDPVGHACHNDAEYLHEPTGEKLCQKCADAITGKGWDYNHAATQIMLPKSGLTFSAPTLRVY